MSRPPTADRDLVRTVRVEIRIKPRQRDRWEAKAKRLGLSLSEWLRMLADRDARM